MWHIYDMPHKHISKERFQQCINTDFFNNVHGTLQPHSNFYASIVSISGRNNSDMEG